MMPLDQMRAWRCIAWYIDIGHSHYPQHPKIRIYPGVYAIWHQSRLLYIGYSKNLYQRARWHFLYWGNKTSDARLWPTHLTAIEMDDAEAAASFEADLILHHKPKFNARREPKGGQVRIYRPQMRTNFYTRARYLR